MATVPAWLHSVLEENNTNRYDIEYDGFKSNHVAHGIIAQWRLGFDEETIRSYIPGWSKRLEPAIWDAGMKEGVFEPALLDADTLKELLGQRKHYLRLVAHYQQRLIDFDNDLDRVIDESFPMLSAGMLSSALHGVIQMGYGYAAQDGRTVCEGLAYMHRSFFPQRITCTDEFINKLGSGDENILDVLAKVREEGELLKYANENPLHFGDQRDRAKFSIRAHGLLDRKGDDIASIVCKIKFPEWFDKNNIDKEQLKKMGHWLTNCAILVYGISDDKNDFFLLHGVTGAWSFAQFLPIITQKDAALSAVLHFLSALIAVYVTQYCPPLKESNLTTQTSSTWEDVIKKSGSGPYDEHIYKLIQVCYEQAKENQEFDRKFLTAAQMVLNHPYTYTTSKH